MWLKARASQRVKRRWATPCRTITAILCLWAASAHSACHDFSRDTSAATPVVFEGTLDTKKLRIAVWAAGAGRVEGFYGYAARSGELKLRGELSADADSLVLDESDASGRHTGTFKLRFDVPDDFFLRGKDPRAYDCIYLTGNWVDPDGQSQHKITLIRDGWLNEAYKSERETDEASAYRLQMAVARRDVEAFDALLRYPVYTQGFNAGNDVWHTTDDVMRDFSSVLRAKHAHALLAVPHALFAGPLGSSFWDGSVCLSHGQVTQICTSGCEGGCP